MVSESVRFRGISGWGCSRNTMAIDHGRLGFVGVAPAIRNIGPKLMGWSAAFTQPAAEV
jgi:hypothetical protein